MTYGESDAVVYLKRVNGQQVTQLREEREAYGKEVDRLENLIEAFVDRFNDEPLRELHKCKENDPCFGRYVCYDDDSSR